MQNELQDTPTKVLLLKTISSPCDNYEKFFGQSTCPIFEPFFVPVLQHRLYRDTLEWLETSILNKSFTTGQNAFGGIIFTSQKAVEAFSHAVSAIDAGQLDGLLPDTLPLYVVGTATANAVRAIGLRCAVLGEDTGSGDVLADFILNDYHSYTHEGRPRPLLFLVGEQRRDIIPRKLQSEELPEQRRIKVIEKTVYEIAERDAFAGDLDSILDKSRTTQSLWIVVFSPTGCEAMLRGLGWLDDNGRYDERLSLSHWQQVRVATIGPTTFDYLKERFGFQAHVCAEKPSPDGVGRGIISYIAAKRGSD